MKPILLTLILAASAFAQTAKLEGDPNPQPKFINAKLEYASAANGLKPVFDQAVQRSGAHWIGYSVPSAARSRFICCFDSYDDWQQRNGCCSGCRLEREGGSFVNSRGGTCVNPEPTRAILVLFRAENGQVEKVRSFAPDCGLDAGNLSVVWIKDVKPRESLALLEGFTKGLSGDGDDNDDSGKKGSKSARGALQAIALHDDPEADKILARKMVPGQPRGVRKQAAFWAGNERGKAGFELLKRIVPNDPDPRFRRDGTFALSQSSEEQDAIRELIKMAKRRDPVVRKEAIFWLGQTKDPRALAFIEQLLLSKK